jgi:hypothetical protein
MATPTPSGLADGTAGVKNLSSRLNRSNFRERGWTTVPSCPSVSTWKNQKGSQGRSAVSGYEAGLRCYR